MKIAIANQKGGVGKTATVSNLAACFAAGFSKPTLVIDLDPQGNLSTSLGIAPNQRNQNTYKLLTTPNANSHSYPISTEIPKLDIIPSVIDLAACEAELITQASKEYLLKRHLDNLQKRYELIIIDCPPSLGILTINALTAADKLIIPMQSEFLAMEGIAYLTNIIKLIKKRLNPQLELDGIVITMHDRRNKLSQQVEAELKNTFKELVYPISIPRNVKISESTSHGIPAILYDNRCLGSLCYMLLAKDLHQKWFQKDK